MARMYSRKRGKSKSTRPVRRVRPSWLSYDEKTIEQLVVKLAKQGKSASQIGVVLRDSYGVPDVRAATGRSVGEVLVVNGLGGGLPDDLRALIRRDIGVLKHVGLNRKDMVARRGVVLTGSRIHRLVRYYKRVGRLPVDWVYDRSKAKVLVES